MKIARFYVSRRAVTILMFVLVVVTSAFAISHGFILRSLLETMLLILLGLLIVVHVEFLSYSSIWKKGQWEKLEGYWTMFYRPWTLVFIQVGILFLFWMAARYQTLIFGSDLPWLSEFFVQVSFVVSTLGLDLLPFTIQYLWPIWLGCSITIAVLYFLYRSKKIRQGVIGVTERFFGINADSEVAVDIDEVSTGVAPGLKFTIINVCIVGLLASLVWILCSFIHLPQFNYRELGEVSQPLSSSKAPERIEVNSPEDLLEILGVDSPDLFEDFDAGLWNEVPAIEDDIDALGAIVGTYMRVEEHIIDSGDVSSPITSETSLTYTFNLNRTFEISRESPLESLIRGGTFTAARATLVDVETANLELGLTPKDFLRNLEEHSIAIYRILLIPDEPFYYDGRDFISGHYANFFMFRMTDEVVTIYRPGSTTFALFEQLPLER